MAYTASNELSGKDICCGRQLGSGYTDRSGTYHKVTLDKLELPRQTLADGIPGGASNLVVVVVETGDVGIGELGNLPCGSAHTAPNIQHLHAGLDANLRREEVLMA